MKKPMKHSLAGQIKLKVTKRGHNYLIDGHTFEARTTAQVWENLDIIGIDESRSHLWGEVELVESHRPATGRRGSRR